MILYVHYIKPVALDDLKEVKPIVSFFLSATLQPPVDESQIFLVCETVDMDRFMIPL